MLCYRISFQKDNGTENIYIVDNRIFEKLKNEKSDNLFFELSPIQLNEMIKGLIIYDEFFSFFEHRSPTNSSLIQQVLEGQASLTIVGYYEASYSYICNNSEVMRAIYQAITIAYLILLLIIVRTQIPFSYLFQYNRS